MSWKLVFGLSILGLAMAIASVLWVEESLEPYLWLGLLALSAFAIAKRAPGRYFLHGFVLSVVNSVWVTAAHLVLFEERHIIVHARLLSVPVQLGSPQVAMAVVGSAAGIASGLVLGLMAWGTSAFVVSSHSEFAGW